MQFPFYRRKTNQLPQQPFGPSASPRSGQEDPKGYDPDPGLVDAVNVALLLDQPLLLTGKPGTGKTRLAFHLSWQLGLGEPLVFEAKTTSTAKDLFYFYDTLGRFRAAQTKEGSSDSLDYLTYNVLGIAILNANARAKVSEWLPPGFEHAGPKRSVVLIDEIDKAPRDFPNDILNEVENMFFRVQELRNARIAADRSMKPILILTSNSEKHLPDAFLRRCVFYSIPYPDRDRLRQIVAGRVGKLAGGSSRLLKDALDIYESLRGNLAGLQREPATAELLSWVTYLAERIPSPDEPLRQHPGILRTSLSALVKSEDDQAAALAVVEKWLLQQS